MTLSYAIVIPARYKSSRFLGKPLVDLCGKPMIQHVWERCCIATEKENVFIATDDIDISKVCAGFGAKVIFTSETCKTGTDRVAEANLELDVDFVINVQGDEPLINPEDIKGVLKAYIENPTKIINAMCKITSAEEYNSFTIPKVVTTLSGDLLYMSRSPIPGNKDSVFNFAYKQVCIYAFSREHLAFFSSIREKTPLESSEDIEILRFLENGIKVQMLEVSQGNLAVDVPSDALKVIERLQEINDLKLT